MMVHAKMHVWKKQVRPAETETWSERLGTVVDPGRVVIVESPHGRLHRVEVYLETAAETRLLLESFGGRVSEVRPESWQPAPVTTPGKPLNIGGRLLVTSREEELASLRQTHPGKHVLCIPAAMAFGTGEHATTSMCLRLLLDVARERAGTHWDLLDLGMGSGILALAGKQLGAQNVLGVDNDPHAVRTARENARFNGLAGRRVRFEQAELPVWHRAPEQMWPVVTANLFSELLIRLLPEIISPSVVPGGDLILSGVLATQSEEVVAAVESAALTLRTTKRRGRWRAFHCVKPISDL